MRAVLLSTDLMSQSRVEGAASAAGATLHTCASPDETLALCAASVDAPIELVLIDLGAGDWELDTLVRALRELTPPPKVIAYGPHVQVNRLQAARSAGCDEVLARGAFLNSIGWIFTASE